MVSRVNVKAAGRMRVRRPLVVRVIVVMVITVRYASSVIEEDARRLSYLSSASPSLRQPLQNWSWIK